jgi:hypothetical protein
VVKAWSPVALLGGNRTLTAGTRSSGDKGHVLKKIMGLQTLPLSSTGHEVGGFAPLHVPTMMCHHRPKSQQGQVNMD